MSRYEMEESGQLDLVGSVPPRLLGDRANEYGPLDPVEGDPMPQTNTVMIMGGIDYGDRFVYALRLAAFHKEDPDQAARLWVEHEFFDQKERLDTRKKRANSSGSPDLIDEYEVNLMNFEEYNDTTILVIAGLGSASGRYERGQVDVMTKLLYHRTIARGLITIVVPMVLSMPDYYDWANFREGVMPLYEQFDLT